MTTAVAWPTPAAEPVAHARKPARSRRVMFDVVRLLAAYAIVWLHTPRSAALANSTSLGRFAVPFFVCATIFFIWQGLVEKPARRWSRYAVSRLTRIYLPFLAWSLIYLAFKAGKAAALPNQPNDFPGIEFLWLGSFYHLWFMPFILVVSVVVFAVSKWLVPRDEIQGPAAVMAALVGGMLATMSAPAWTESVEGAIWAWNALPAVFFGLTLAIFYQRGGAQLLERTPAALIGLAILALGTFWVWQFGRDNMAENLAGVGCTIVALAPWDARWLRALATFGPLAYGIYLSHLLFIKSAESIFTKFGVENRATADLTVFCVAVVGSTSLAWCLSRSRYTRWLAA